MTGKINENVTLGIPTTGNIEALLITLTAVIQGLRLPARILIRMEGHFPAFGNFYLEQLSDVIRQRGVEFTLTVAPSLGLRAGVDWLMANIVTPYFWMLSDDVLPAFDALAQFENALACIVLDATDDSWGYIVGNKQDVNNRRKWPDYSQQIIPADEVKDYATTYGNYSVNSPIVVRNRLLDNSHAFFNLRRIKENPKLSETVFPDGFQSGGDDTLFGLLLQQQGLTSWFCPRSQAFHLEKLSQNFGEPVARAEAIYRQCQLLDIPTEDIFTTMFPYTAKYNKR